MKTVFSALLAVALLVGRLGAGTVASHAEVIRSLADPAKLKTLGERGANPRIQKIVFQLAVAKAEKLNLTNVLDTAFIGLAMPSSNAVAMTKAALLRNLEIAGRLGALDADGLSEMRQGKAATVKAGPYRGDQLSVDHVIPRAVAPELDNVLANLELMPGRMNSGKRDKVGERQVATARKLHQAGLLSADGLKAVLREAMKGTKAKQKKAGR